MENTSLTVKELIELLEKQSPDAQVFISSDEEGNSYGGVAENAMEIGTADNVVVFYPSPERLEWDEVFPKQWEQESDDDRDV